MGHSVENAVNNQRKQNKHLGMKEDLHSLFGHIGSVLSEDLPPKCVEGC